MRPNALMRNLIGIIGTVLFFAGMLMQIGSAAAPAPELSRFTAADVMLLVGMLMFGVWWWWSIGHVLWVNRRRKLYIALIVGTLVFVIAAMRAGAPGPMNLGPVTSITLLVIGVALLLMWMGSGGTDTRAQRTARRAKNK
jgi:hypothetical protein